MYTFAKGETREGFSLIEVVIATAVFATSIVAIIGLMSPLTKRVDDIIDSETASRLAESIQTELNRIGFSDTKDLMGGINGTTDITLVANPQGDRVRLLSDLGGIIYANNALDDATLPGIADRDRYFLISVTHQSPFTAHSGALALRADVLWPYQLPVGPASATSVNHDDDPAVLAATSSQQTLAFFFALTP